MESEHQVNIKMDLLSGVIVAAWMVITLIILSKFGIKDGWSAFLVLLLFFESGAKIENLKNIFVGAAVGLLLATVMKPAIGLVTGILGLELAIVIILFLIVFSIISLGNVAHMFCNNYTFLYFTIGTISAFQQPHIFEWLAVLFLGGVFFVGGILFVAKKMHMV